MERTGAAAVLALLLGGATAAETAAKSGQAKHLRGPSISVLSNRADLISVPERIPGDDGAIRNAYRSGALNQANNLDRVAIINLSAPTPGSPTTSAMPRGRANGSCAPTAMRATT